jgi:hypothetical protein
VLSFLSFESFHFIEVLGIVNGEIVKVTDESVQKEIDINTEVLEIVNSEIAKVRCIFVPNSSHLTTIHILSFLLFKFFF